MVAPLLPLTALGIEVRRRGKPLLGPIDLQLDQPQITIVLGPNGAGKTTLLKALHGIERLSAGTVTWGVTREEAARRQSFVFQTPIMLRRSVGENLTYPLALAGHSKPDIVIAVNAWAKRIDLEDALERNATRLSGGEKQKLALARALINKPDLLFLDEPCTNLDGRATREIEALLTDAHAGGTSIIIATHDLGQARRLGQHVIFLLASKIHEQGAADICFNTPHTPALQAFLKGDIVE